MDECMMLNDLLECSVCLEQLDSNSKVLPCQHTFCKRCLDEIVSSRKELRCPECRELVETKVSELPGNILLIRILEGMKNVPRNRALMMASSGGGGGGGGIAAEPEPIVRGGGHQQPLVPQPLHQQLLQQRQLQQMTATVDNQYVPSPPPKQSSGASVHQPSARALYSYEAKETGDLSFKKGDTILLRKKIDQNWFHGELAGKHGFFPASYVRVITPLPVHMPQCKAIYDFRMSGNEEKDCLAFTKGEVIVVIRRVDENWAEGKLGERIGIFPISFVEMNGAARSLMKLSTNFQSGPSRVAPPTPSSDSDTTPLITPANSGVPVGAVLTPSIQPSASSSSSSSSSSLSSSSPSSSSSTTCTSSSSSSSASTPSSPAVSAPTPSLIPLSVAPHHFRQSSQQGTSPHPPLPATPRQTTSPHNQQQHSEKRHSLSSFPAILGRHSVALSENGAANGGGGGQTTVNAPAVQSRHRLSAQVPPPNEEGSSDSLACSSTPNLFVSIGPPSSPPTHVPVPIFYVALYPYKPQKEDELELKKGELYTVSEKCQDGWFKGTSLRTTLSGVFPGNYVQAAKSSLLQAHFRQTSSSLANVRPTSSRVSSLPNVISTTPCSSSSTSTSSVPVLPNAQCSSRNHRNHHHHHHHHHHHNNNNEQQQSSREMAAAAVATSSSSVASGSSTGNGGIGDVSGLSRARAAAATVVSERTHGFLEWARSVTALASYSPNSKQVNHSPRYRAHTAPRQSTTTITSSSSSTRTAGVPELPPRVSNSVVASANTATPPPPPGLSAPQPASISQSWHGTPSMQQQRVYPASGPLSKSVQNSGGDASAAQSPRKHGTASSSMTPVVANHGHRHDKLSAKRDKKERKQHDKVSFVKRLTAKKSKLKSPTQCGYSMDNPVFVDCTPTSSGPSGLSATPFAHGSHVRSGSCPSDVVFVGTPPLPAASATVASSAGRGSGRGGGGGGGGGSGHKKSNSIDGSTDNSANIGKANLPRPPAPLVRERYRCIVPYPPNGENELELKVGDIIYVQKKRDDGWYKGVLHRTGKSGLFPASFVESF